RRYPGAGERIVVLENGYDEESFALAENGSVERSALNPGSFTLLHSGIVYPSERDPSQLMRALALLKAGGAVRPGELKLRFRASAHDDMLRALAAQHEV